MNDDVKKELNRQMVTAQANLDVKRQETMMVVNNVYANPRGSLTSMMNYSRKHGDAALSAKLEKDPAFFGTMKGHLGAPGAISLQGMRDKTLSKEQARILPGLIRETLEADNKLLALERSVEGRGGGPERGKGGIDF